MVIISKMNPCIKTKSPLPRGFSLLEVLMVVALISTITAGTIVMVGDVTKAAGSTKLQRDVRVLNSAIRSYLLNGGTLLSTDLSDPAKVLAKLKTTASAGSAKQIAGLRGVMLDERLVLEMQSEAEAGEGVERARFIADPANPRFVVQNDGPPGISRFVLDPDFAARDYGTEERETSMKLAKRDAWVWDYSDQGPGRGVPGTPPAVNPYLTNPNPEDAANTVLSPPKFSIPAGELPLSSYPLELALLSPNPAGSSEILYGIDGGAFSRYDGPVSIEPGTTVTAMTATLDPDHYEDSPASAAHTYTTSPVNPEPVLDFGKSGFNYFELGGDAAPGSPDSPGTGEVSGTGTLANLSMIPAAYQNSSVFRFVWTYDGSNPLNSASAQNQPDFTDSFVPAVVPLPLTVFGTARTVTVQGAVKSANSTLVSDSVIVSQTLAAAVLPLRPPLVHIDGRDVTLSLDVSGGDMPANARIFYTTDGTDPGVDEQGNPLRGTLYDGRTTSLDGATGSDQSVIARVYAPLPYLQFFNVSTAASVEFLLPADTSIYVGGAFVNTGGSLMRNIARLNNSGQIDERFNTGSGASGNSIVGVVRQAAGGVMAGGDFQSVNGTIRMGVARLNGDGSLDSGFDAGLTSN